MWLLYAFMNYATGGSDTTAADAEENQTAWIVWALSAFWAPLSWIREAFRWCPEGDVFDPLDTAEGTSELLDGSSPTVVDELSLADHTRQDEQQAGAVGGGRMLNPFGMWRQLWLDNPAGSFLYDHWVAAMLAGFVIAISSCSLLYSLLQSDLGIARLIRRVFKATKFWLKAIVVGYLAASVTMSGLEDYWLQSEYVVGYCVVWVGMVLGVAALDAISDALGRPSTFTQSRVILLFASMFAIGLPMLFYTAADGAGWRLVSPVAFGIGLDGLGRAFLSQPLRDLAYLPIRSLSWVAEQFERTVLWGLRFAAARLFEGLEAFLRSRFVAAVVDKLWEVRLPCGVAGVSSYMIANGLERFGQFQTEYWLDHHCVVGGVHILAGVLGLLLAVELFSRDHNGHPRHLAFSRPCAVAWAVLCFCLTIVVPRSLQFCHYYVVLAATKLVALAREMQLVRIFQAARAGLVRVIKGTWNGLCWLGNRAWGVWLRVHRVCEIVWGWLRRVATASWQVAHGAGATVYSWLTRTASAGYRWMSRVLRAIWSAFISTYAVIQRPIQRLVLAIWRPLCDIAVRLGRAAWRPLKRLSRLVYAQFEQLTRAWWRLLPAGLAVQTCIRFGLAILRSPPPAASAVLGFALASFAVGIIAIILARDLLMRTFAWSNATNRQYIATDHTSEFYATQSRVDNLMLYVDLGSVAAARWTITNAGSVLRLLIQHGATWAAKTLRWLFQQAWRIGELLCTWVALPVLRRVKAIVLVIWNSPVLSTAAALGSLWLLWAHHSGTWRWVMLEHFVVLGRTSGLELLEVTLAFALEHGGTAAELASRWGGRALGVIMSLLNSTTEQLVAAAEAGDIESPRLAWVVWLTIVTATKSQTEIRFKTLMWPFVVLWVTAMMGYAQQLPQVVIGVLCWCGAAVWVRNYEQRERDRVRNHWMQRRPPAAGFRAGRQAAAAAARAGAGAGAGAAQPLPPRPTGKPKERKFKDQTECSICLESLSVRPDGAAAGAAADGEDAIGMLPCGHCFHSECIGEWLQREARCPLCRQSARGIDRVLEIVF